MRTLHELEQHAVEKEVKENGEKFGKWVSFDIGSPVRACVAGRLIYDIALA